MPILVTGAMGFLGSRLVEKLVEAGEEVRCLVRRPGPVDSPKSTAFHLANFSRADLGVPNSVFKEIVAVYHLAGAKRSVSEHGFKKAYVAVTGPLLHQLTEQ